MLWANSEFGDSIVFNIDGNIDVSSYNGYSRGILATSWNGLAGVYNTGDITVSTLNSSATGIQTSWYWGDVGVYNEGDISTSGTGVR